MGYLTRQLLLELVKLREAHENQSSAIHKIQEEEHRCHQIELEILKKRSSKYEKSVREDAVGQKRQNEIQQSICSATWTAAFFTLLAVIAASVYACITHDMWKEMKAQTRIAQQSMIAQNRPWLGVSSFAKPEAAPPKAALTFTNVIIKNYGHAPAQRIVARFKLFSADNTSPGELRAGNIKDKMSSLCGDIEEVSRNVSADAKTMFPDAAEAWKVDESGDQSKLLGMKSPANFIYLMGCIVYQDPADLKRGTEPLRLHHTKVLFRPNIEAPALPKFPITDFKQWNSDTD